MVELSLSAWFWKCVQRLGLHPRNYSNRRVLRFVTMQRGFGRKTKCLSLFERSSFHPMKVLQIHHEYWSSASDCGKRPSTTERGSRSRCRDYYASYLTIY